MPNETIKLNVESWFTAMHLLMQPVRSAIAKKEQQTAVVKHGGK